MGMLNPSNWGLTEIILVLAIVLIFFGPKRLPQLSRAIGSSIRDFRKGLTEIRDDIEKEEPAAKTTASPNIASANDIKPAETKIVDESIRHSGTL